MALARLALFPGGTEEQYKALVDALGPAHTEANGRIMLSSVSVHRCLQLV